MAGFEVLSGLQIRCSEYLGERVQIRFPKATVRRYKQRTARRYARDPRNWVMRGKGEFYIVDGREIWCHPDDLGKLKRHLEAEVPDWADGHET